MGVCPKGGGVPGEVEPARSPARCMTGTQGTVRGGRGRREPLRTTGTRHRALRGGKGRSRAFGQHLQKEVGGRGQTMHAVGHKGSLIQGTRHRRSQGGQALGMRREHG